MVKNMNKSKKQSLIRTWFQAAWFVFTNSYLRGFTKGKIFAGNTKVVCFPGLNCYSCPGALAACPMGALQAVMGDVTYRISLYVFGFLSVMGVLFGRLICGWMCPFGLVQDLFNRIPFPIKLKNLPGHKCLKYLRYLILVVFPLLLVSIVTDVTGAGEPWFCEWICPSGMLFGGIPLVSVNAGLREAIGGRFFWKLFVLIVILLMSIVVYRPFCKYLCPLGAIYGLFNPISSYRLVIDKEKCISCGQCHRVCGMDIMTCEHPNSPECIRCGSCISACPKGAISSTWRQTQDKIKSRCFVDDDEVNTKSVNISPGIRNKVIFFGIATILLGLFSVFVTFFYGIFVSLDGRMTIDEYADIYPMYLAFDTVLAISAAMLLLIGIYTLKNRNNPKALMSVKEKTSFVFVLNVIAFVLGIIGAVIDIKNLGVIFIPIRFGAGFIVGTLIALLMGSLLKKMLQTGKEHNVRWIILSVLYVLNVLYLPLLEIHYRL